MKILRLMAASAVLMYGPALAQAIDGSDIVLPLGAQSCNLPVAPARISVDADLDALKTAKGNVTAFQSSMIKYRDCLDSSIQDETSTEGNKQAVANAHNYSVEMEERIAEQFNVAVRAYKARMAEETK